jgi:hypothetical protein
MSILRRAVLAAAFAAVAVPSWSQEKPPSKVPPPPTPNAIILARSWDEAIKEATIRNVPILFTTALAT